MGGKEWLNLFGVVDSTGEEDSPSAVSLPSSNHSESAVGTPSAPAPKNLGPEMTRGAVLDCPSLVASAGNLRPRPHTVQAPNSFPMLGLTIFGEDRGSAAAHMRLPPRSTLGASIRPLS